MADDRPAEPGGREALAAALHPLLIGGTGNAAASCGGACRELADRLLASDWLRDHDAAVRAEALREAADAARGMHDPVAPDCEEWASWLEARATRTPGGDR